MAMPKQVQKDMAELEAYDAAVRTEQESAAAPVVQTEVTTEVVADPAEPVAVVPAEQVEPASNVVDIKPAADEKAWEQRYKTLQGMQQAEVRSHKELKHQFEELQAEVEELRKPREVAAPISLVSDEEIVEFGADLLDVQRRITREEMTPVLAQVTRLEQENKALRKQMGNTDAQVASSAFEQKLALAVPDFDTINDDPKWAAWLDDVDPILRGPRRIVAQAAYARGDIEAIASYVGMFKSTGKPVSAAATTAASELKSQVAPMRSVSGTKELGDAQLRIYSEAETSKLFDKVGLLYRQGKTEEASKLDTELTLAYHQGRVR